MIYYMGSGQPGPVFFYEFLGNYIALTGKE